jgi:hypothetical protein
MRWLAGMLVGCVAASFCEAATFQEDFSGNPMGHGWHVVGKTNLFQWDATNQNLHVTWDSSQTNTYFYRSLGTLITRDDDFHLAFDLVLDDAASGTSPGKPYAFPLAIGFLNLANATQTNFSRGAGINATYGPDNLIEFNFFPTFDIFQPTIDQVMVATNNAWLFNHDNLLDMPPGDMFHVDMNYQASTRTLTTIVLRNGAQYGVTQMIQVPANDFDFRVGVISISSYSDQHADSSLLAHGTVDNIAVTVPDPPAQNLTGSYANGHFQALFTSQTNWLYTLERTPDLQSWNPVPGTAALGTGGILVLTDASASLSLWNFYRVRADRP